MAVAKLITINLYDGDMSELNDALNDGAEVLGTFPGDNGFARVLVVDYDEEPEPEDIGEPTSEAQRETETGESQEVPEPAEEPEPEAFPEPVLDAQTGEDGFTPVADVLPSAEDASGFPVLQANLGGDDGGTGGSDEASGTEGEQPAEADEQPESDGTPGLSESPEGDSAAEDGTDVGSEPSDSTDPEVEEPVGDLPEPEVGDSPTDTYVGPHAEILAENGLTTNEQIKAKSEDELIALNGIADARLADIQAYLSTLE